MRLIGQKLGKIILCGFFALIFIIGNEKSVSAIDIEQKDLSVSAHSSSLTIHNNGIGTNDFQITPQLEFNKLGDFITYKLTLRNNDGKKYKITEVKDDNINDAIELTYAYPTTLDTTDKSLELTIKYVKRSTASLQTITITINLVDEDYLNQQISLTVPNTGANIANNTSFSDIRNAVIIYVIFAVAIILYIIIHYRYQKSQNPTKLPKIITATLLLAGLIPVAVIAVSLKDLQFIVEFGQIKVNTPHIVTFDTTTMDVISPQTVDHNDLAIRPEDPQKTGYIFKNWLDEDNRVYDFTKPVTKDLNLVASFEEKLNIPIVYNDNGANSPTTMNDQHIKGSDTEVVLWTSNFWRSGFGFAGWNTKPDGSGTSYGPNETINDEVILNSIKTDGLTLYAMWVESIGDFQTWHGCNAMNIGDVTALTDTRDNNVYAIAKLADGNCWMIENLRLDNSNSDNATGALAQGYNSSFIGLADSEVANFGDSDIANSLYSTDGSTAAPAIAGDGAGSRFPRYNNKSTISPATEMASEKEPYIYSQGNYYTWPAAVADTSYYATDGQIISSTSICPKGWKLPTGGKYDIVGQNADFNKLAAIVAGEEPHATEYYGVVYYGETTGVDVSNKLRAYPNNFIYAGYYNGTGPSTTRGSAGGYWSSTSAGAQKGYGFGFDVDLVGSGMYTKGLGFPVRCVAADTYTITFDSNGGSGNMDNQIVAVDTNTALSSNTFAHSKFGFIGWSTAADGDGALYTNKQSIMNLAQVGQSITLYAQWGPVITYDDNGANSPTTMGDQFIKTSDTKVTLWASNFQRPGYGFAGWNTMADGNGTSFGPNHTIKDQALLADIKENSLTLYAMWVPSAGNLQSWGGCPSLSQGSVTALTDTRDGNTYAVAKLGDNKCWMIENLRLSNTHIETGAPVTISSSNTNNPASGFTLNAPQDITKNAWCTDLNAACIDQSRYDASNTQNTIQTMDSPDANIYSYGNYYNWYTAMAGRGTYSLSTNAEASGDICPSGWHAPSGGGDGMGSDTSEYSILNRAISNTLSEASSIAFRSYPNNFVYSGYAYNNSFRVRSSYVTYWSSTAQANGRGHGLYVYETGILPGTGSGEKRNGLTLRCLKNS